MHFTPGVLARSLDDVAQSRADYFDQWTVDTAFPVDGVLDDTFARIHAALGSAIDLFVTGFDRWSRLVSFPPLAHRIHDLYDGAGYDKGTFRTDVIFDTDGTPRLIEITCRFVMNGFVLESVFNEIARRRGFVSERVDRYAGFPAVLAHWLGPDPVLIRGEESRNDSALLELLAARGAIDLTIVVPGDLARSWGRLQGRRVVSEMNHGELERLDDDVIRRLIDAGVRNDLRTSVMVHDKGFFALMAHPEFLSELPGEDARILTRHVVPTWVASERTDLWADVVSQRAGWIIKPRTLGRSEGVLAGPLVGEAEWAAATSRAHLADTVIQRFIPQPRWRTRLRGRELHDYVVGTLLFAQEGYFGPGVFRLSSLPVTNVGDDRKAWG